MSTGLQALRRLGTTLLVAGVLLPLAVAAPAEAADRTSYREAHRVAQVKTPKLRWYAAPDGFGFQSTVRLPRDYDKPKGATVEIALFKLPAADRANKIGTLFINPGGPGGSGVEMARAAPSFLSQAVLDRFDIVGFDPRGTNNSSRLKCFSSVGKQYTALAGMDILLPYSPAEETRYVESAKKLAKACSYYGDPLSESMSTAEVARDMDVLRRAVGDSKLNYLGFSYGTYLGEVYANMFPDRFRAIVLDGVIDPVAWAGTSSTRSVPTTLRVKSAEASWSAVVTGLAACKQAGPTYCPLADPKADFEKVARTLRDNVPRAIALGQGQIYDMSYAEFISDVLGALYFPDGMDFVAALTAQELKVINGDVTDPGVTAAAAAANSLVKAFHQSVAAGGYDFPYDNSLEAYSGVLCTDTYQPQNPRSWIAATHKADTLAPYFGRAWGWVDVQCATDYWKARDEDAYHGSFSRQTAATVLIVGNYHDPATNYGNAVETYRLMPNSALLSSDSWGHTAYGTSECVTSGVDAYLLDRKLPGPTVCTGDMQPFTTALKSSTNRRSTSPTKVPSRDGLPPITQPWVQR